MHAWKKQLFCGVCIVLFCLAGFSSSAVTVSAETTGGVSRIWGADRYATAFSVANAVKEEKQLDRFETVVLACGSNFPDALTGSYLAVSKNAPILMVNSKNQTDLLRYLEENLVSDGTVFILGGEKAVSAELETKLSAYRTIRIQGATRYETNLAVLRQAGVAEGQILVCTGKDFADSLSAAATNKPILLVEDRLTQAQKAYLSTLKQPQFCVVGGEKAVCAELEEELSAYGVVSRLEGATRLETSVAVAKAFFDKPASAVLAYAWNFPDGLCGSPLAVKLGGPVILAANKQYSAAMEYVQDKQIATGFVLGGSGLIGDSAVRNIFGLDASVVIGDWLSKREEMSQVKPENVETVRNYAAKLYAENTQDDYINADFTWDMATRSSNWIYFTGLVYDSFLQTDFDAYNSEIRTFFNQYISEDGSIPKYIAGELDSAMLPAVMLKLLNSNVLTVQERERYALAADYVYDQLEKQTIYPEAGNLWLHSQKADGTPRPAWTKWNVCLDGVFMSQIFLVRLTEAIDKGNVQITGKGGSVVSSDKLWDDIYSRLTFVMENMRDPQTNLLFHGYCVKTGETNKACWSRGLGWYAMVLMEAAENIPGDERKAVLKAYYQSLMSAVVKWQDPATGLWYNVTDGREEYYYKKTQNGTETVIYNMPESSGSAMFAYCLLRGYHKGLLDDDSFRAAGLWAFNALTETKLTQEGLTDIYSSSSVTGDKNLYQKNGYVVNDGKGVGPFIMAANYAY